MMKNLEIILCLIFIVFVDQCYFYEPVEHIKIGLKISRKKKFSAKREEKPNYLGWGRPVPLGIYF